MSRRSIGLRWAGVALVGGMLAVACGLPAGPPAEIPDGVPARGVSLMQRHGCIACHAVPGVGGADAHVGPPLDRFKLRSFIAGRLENTPDNLVRWITDPQSVDPETAMPDVGLTPEEARDIAAYLYTLR